MKIQTTTWKPDVCDCKLQYSVDGDLPDNKKLLFNYVVLSKCNRHKDVIGSDEDLYNLIRKDCIAKTKILEHISTDLNVKKESINVDITNDDINIQINDLAPGVILASMNKINLQTSITDKIAEIDAAKQAIIDNIIIENTVTQPLKIIKTY